MINTTNKTTGLVALLLIATAALSGCGGEISANASSAAPTTAASTPNPGGTTGSTPATGSTPTSTPPTTPPPGGSTTPSTGSASLAWLPPTQNTDGSALVNLGGYHIYYGTDVNNLSQVIDIVTPGLTRYVVDNLALGTWYFTIRAYNLVGLESDQSNSASKTIS
jgi:hypothetical protein